MSVTSGPMGGVAEALEESEGSDDSTLLFYILPVARIGDFTGCCSFAGQHERSSQKLGLFS